jgi:hypothetical protein
VLIVQGNDHVSIEESEGIGHAEVIEALFGDTLRSASFRIVSESVILDSMKPVTHNRYFRPFQLNKTTGVP